MIKILPPEDLANGEESRSPPSLDGRPTKTKPIVSGAPQKIGDTDFAEIERIIRDKESQDQAKKDRGPKPAKPPGDGHAKPGATAKPTARASTSPLPPLATNRNPLAPRPIQSTAAAIAEKPLLPSNEWTSPASLRRRKIMLISLAVVAGLLLVGGGAYLIVRNMSRDRQLARSKSSETTINSDEKPKASSEKSAPADREERQTKVPVISGDKDDAKQSPKQLTQKESSVEEQNSPPPALPIDDSQPPALPTDESQPKLPTTDSNNGKAAAPNPDDKKKSSPLAPPRLVDRLPDNPSIAPNTSTEPKMPFELLESSDLKSLFQQSGTSLAEIGELTNLDSVLETSEPAKFFVKRSDLANKKSPEEILASKIPKLQYPEISPRQFLAEISKLVNLPIAIAAQDAINHQLDLAKRTSFDSSGPNLESILNEYFGKMKFEVTIHEWGLRVRPVDSLIPVAREFELPKFPSATPDDYTDVVSGIKSMIAPTTWAPDAKTGLEIAGEKLVVNQSPSALFEIERLLNKIDASLQIGETNIQNLPTALLTRTRQFSPKSAGKLVWNQSRALTLDEFALELQEQAGVELFFDWEPMVVEGWNHQTTLPLYFRPESVDVAINELCKALQVSYEYLDAQTVKITTRSSAAATRDIEFYPIQDLLARGLKAEAIIELLNQTVGRNVVNDRRAPITCTFYEKPKAVVVVAPQHIQRQIEAVLVRLRTR